MKKRKKFEEFGCAFRNEAECGEDLEEAGSNLNEVEEEYFDEE